MNKLNYKTLNKKAIVQLGFWTLLRGYVTRVGGWVAANPLKSVFGTVLVTQTDVVSTLADESEQLLLGKEKDPVKEKQTALEQYEDSLKVKLDGAFNEFIDKKKESFGIELMRYYMHIIVGEESLGKSHIESAKSKHKIEYDAFSTELINSLIEDLSGLLGPADYKDEKESLILNNLKPRLPRYKKFFDQEIDKQISLIKKGAEDELKIGVKQEMIDSYNEQLGFFKGKDDKTDMGMIVPTGLSKSYLDYYLATRPTYEDSSEAFREKYIDTEEPSGPNFGRRHYGYRGDNSKIIEEIKRFESSLGYWSNKTYQRACEFNSLYTYDDKAARVQRKMYQNIYKNNPKKAVESAMRDMVAQSRVWGYVNFEEEMNSRLDKKESPSGYKTSPRQVSTEKKEERAGIRINKGEWQADDHELDMPMNKLTFLSRKSKK